MSQHRPGRPSKPASKRRQQLHISLYPDDIERLDQLTENRSEFIRQCISKAWSEKYDGEITLAVTLPKWLLHGVLKTAAQRLPPDQARAFRGLVDQIMTDEPVVDVAPHPPVERGREERTNGERATGERAVKRLAVSSS